MWVDPVHNFNRRTNPMGGKNHQPCGRYLKNSTLMSRSMSLAMSSLELANVALEDVILAELSGSTGDTTPILLQLDESMNHLTDMQDAACALAEQMKAEDYVDLPPMKTIDMVGFGREMRAAGLHRSEASWLTISTLMQKSGFEQTLRHHSATVVRIMELTRDLKSRIVDTGRAAEDGQLTAELEQNKALNFKAEFARVYTAWAEFQQEFLASSMVSTEVWYSFNKAGSLLELNRGVLAA